MAINDGALMRLVIVVFEISDWRALIGRRLDRQWPGA